MRGVAEFSWVPGRFFLQQKFNFDFMGMLGYDPFAGGWRPNAGADQSVNVPYDISGSRMA
jgi:hypothetical protein